MLGPFPAMYEPVWFPDKTLSAVAEAVAALVAGAAALLSGRFLLVEFRTFWPFVESLRLLG